MSSAFRSRRRAATDEQHLLVARNFGQSTGQRLERNQSGLRRVAGAPFIGLAHIDQECAGGLAATCFVDLDGAGRGCGLGRAEHTGKQAHDVLETPNANSLADICLLAQINKNSWSPTPPGRGLTLRRDSVIPLVYPLPHGTGDSPCKLTRNRL